MREESSGGSKTEWDRRRFVRYRVHDVELKVDFGHRGRIQDIGHGGV